jgi:hypothetical protein
MLDHLNPAQSAQTHETLGGIRFETIEGCRRVPKQGRFFG